MNDDDAPQLPADRVRDRLHANRHRIAKYRAKYADMGIILPDSFFEMLAAQEPMDPRPRLHRSAEGDDKP